MKSPEGRAATTPPNTVKSASDVRERLRQVELGLANLNRGTAEEAVEVVRQMHLVQKAIPRLEGEFGMELKAERAKLQVLEGALRNNAPAVVSKAGAGRLQALRREVDAAEGDWWMNLDTIVSADRTGKVRRLATRVGIGVVVVLVLVVGYQVFLSPSNGSGTTADRLGQAKDYLNQGRLEAALTEYTAALDAGAEGPEAPLAMGAILTQLGRADEASSYLEQARTLSTSEADYYAELSLLYYDMSTQGGLDAVDKAEQAAQAAVAADADSAKAYLALGSVYELQGRVGEAIEALNKASELTTDAALTAAIRMRLGMLSQKPGDLPTVIIEATATP